MTDQQTLLISGAGSGMGQECALYLAAQGYRVYAGYYADREKTDLGVQMKERGVEVHPVPLDVTSTESIQAVVRHILSDSGRIDGLIHFAGMGLRGFFEDLSMEEIRRVYDVNVFGIMELTQAVLPHMRENRRGRIIVTSSVAGRMGSMGIIGYSSSKFAAEGFAECLAQEVKELNIHVSLLEPGLIMTPHFTVNRNRAKRAKLPSSPYYKWFCQHEHIVDGVLAQARFTTLDIAKEVHRILRAPRPRLRYLLAPNARIIFTLRRYIPSDWFERIYWYFLRRMVTRPKKQAPGLSGEQAEQATPPTQERLAARETP